MTVEQAEKSYKTMAATESAPPTAAAGHDQRESSPPLAAGLATAEGDMRDILREKLAAKRSRLDTVQENIKKFVGDRAMVGPAVDGGGASVPVGLRGRFQNRLGPPPGAGPAYPGGLGGRLGPKVSTGGGLGRRGGHVEEEDEMDEGGAPGRLGTRVVVAGGGGGLQSRVVLDQRSREEALAEQRAAENKGDKQRNRRMFGNLLGTLQRFRQDESKVKEREQKKKEIEKKVEERTEQEREQVRQEKRQLFVEKKKQEVEIRVLERQMARVEEFEVWEKAKKAEMRFIRTSGSSAPIYFLPKEHNEATLTLVEENMERVEKEIKEAREKFEDELLQIEESVKNPAKRHEEDEEEEDASQPRSVVTRVNEPHARSRPADRDGRRRGHDDDGQRARDAKRRREDEATGRGHQAGISARPSFGLDARMKDDFAPEKIVVVVKREKSLERDSRRDRDAERASTASRRKDSDHRREEKRPVAAVAPQPRIKKEKASTSPKPRSRARKESSSSSSSSESSSDSSDSSDDDSSDSSDDSSSSSSSSSEDDSPKKASNKGRKIKKERK